jgi:hypothetical protein
MVTPLTRNPHVVQRARDLGLSYHGDCLAAVRAHALRQVQAIVDEAPIPCDSLDTLRRLVANRCGMRLELVESDADIERIADDHRDFHTFLHPRLVAEFLEGSTEGITLEREVPEPHRFRYLAVVDARGERAVRAYFTGWHEIVHLLTHPEQRPFLAVRRTPTPEEVAKDPLESLVDHIAGRIAFYPPLFRPVVRDAMSDHGGLTFTAVDSARATAAPNASLFAAATGALHVAGVPALFATAALALKAEERRFSQGAQQLLALPGIEVEEKLRIPTVVANEWVAASPIAIRRHMRVPRHSIIAQAFESQTDVTLTSVEDQSWWDASHTGQLPRLPIRVAAARRGRFVYALISLAQQTRSAS